LSGILRLSGILERKGLDTNETAIKIGKNFDSLKRGNALFAAVGANGGIRDEIELGFLVHINAGRESLETSLKV